MTFLLALFLGLVQGVAEFLPISSSGHLSIFQNLFNMNIGNGEHLFFDVLLHVGTLISICIAYRKDLSHMITDCVSFVTNREDDMLSENRFTPYVRTVFLIIIATLPLFIALPFNDKIESLYYQTGFIGFALLITGCLLFVGDRFIKPGRKKEKNMTIKDAIIIGVAQAFALFPGLSRSGTTITVGTACGLDREYAMRFSLLMSLPAIVGSTILSLIKAISAGIEWSLVPSYLVGMVIAAVVGYLSIRIIRALISKGKFGYFAYYCWAAGIITLILSAVL